MAVSATLFNGLLVLQHRQQEPELLMAKFGPPTDDCVHVNEINREWYLAGNTWEYSADRAQAREAITDLILRQKRVILTTSDYATLKLLAGSVYGVVHDGTQQEAEAEVDLAWTRAVSSASAPTAPLELEQLGKLAQLFHGRLVFGDCTGLKEKVEEYNRKVYDYDILFIEHAVGEKWMIEDKVLCNQSDVATMAWKHIELGNIVVVKSTSLVEMKFLVRLIWGHSDSIEVVDTAWRAAKSTANLLDMVPTIRPRGKMTDFIRSRVVLMDCFNFIAVKEELQRIYGENVSFFELQIGGWVPGNPNIATLAHKDYSQGKTVMFQSYDFNATAKIVGDFNSIINNTDPEVTIKALKEKWSQVYSYHFPVSRHAELKISYLLNGRLIFGNAGFHAGLGEVVAWKPAMYGWLTPSGAANCKATADYVAKTINDGKRVLIDSEKFEPMRELVILSLRCMRKEFSSREPLERFEEAWSRGDGGKALTANLVDVKGRMVSLLGDSLIVCNSRDYVNIATRLYSLYGDSFHYFYMEGAHWKNEKGATYYGEVAGIEGAQLLKKSHIVMVAGMDCFAVQLASRIYAEKEGVSLELATDIVSRAWGFKPKEPKEPKNLDFDGDEMPILEPIQMQSIPSAALISPDTMLGGAVAPVGGAVAPVVAVFDGISHHSDGLYRNQRLDFHSMYPSIMQTLDLDDDVPDLVENFEETEADKKQRLEKESTGLQVLEEIIAKLRIGCSKNLEELAHESAEKRKLEQDHTKILGELRRVQIEKRKIGYNLLKSVEELGLANDEKRRLELELAERKKLDQQVAAFTEKVDFLTAKVGSLAAKVEELKVVDVLQKMLVSIDNIEKKLDALEKKETPLVPEHKQIKFEKYLIHYYRDSPEQNLEFEFLVKEPITYTSVEQLLIFMVGSHIHFLHIPSCMQRYPKLKRFILENPRRRKVSIMDLPRSIIRGALNDRSILSFCIPIIRAHETSPM